MEDPTSKWLWTELEKLINNGINIFAHYEPLLTHSDLAP